MIRAIAIDESLFDRELIENYQAYRAWLQYFLIHVIHSRIILVPSGRKECWIHAIQEVAPCCLSHQLKSQLEHFLPNRIKEILVTDEWRESIRELCQVKDSALDMLALSAYEHIDVIITRSRLVLKCRNLPMKIRGKIVAWNQYPGKKRLLWETESIGGRCMETADASNEIFTRMLQWSPSAAVCDPYISVALFEHVLCSTGNWAAFQETLKGIWNNWPLSLHGANQRRLTVKSIALRPSDKEKFRWKLKDGLKSEFSHIKDDPMEQAKLLYQHIYSLFPDIDLCVELLNASPAETHDRFLLTNNWALQLSRGFDFESTPYREWFSSMMPLDISPNAMLWTAPAIARWPQ